MPLPRWLNRDVQGMTLTSLLSDACYEMVLAVLPGFLPVIHVAAAALGWIEGASDAFSSVLKLISGWYSDRIGRRKWIVVIGYLFTGTGLSVFSVATSWVPLLGGRLISWFGKGIRGTLRDAMLSESAEPGVRGKVFGFHRAGDTVGAILGPLAGVALLSLLPSSAADLPFRTIFRLSLIPGLAAPLAFAVMVRERPRQPRPRLSLACSLRELPGAFRRFLAAVGLFGAGDFSPTLVTLAAATLLRGQHGAIPAAQIAAALYVVRNVAMAVAAFPIGALADRWPRRPMLAAGYAASGAVAIWMAWLFRQPTAGVAALAGVSVVAGVAAAAKETLEGAIPPDITDAAQRATVYGTLGAVNGAGDLIASATVGTLWTAFSPAAGFGIAGGLMLAGAILVSRR